MKMFGCKLAASVLCLAVCALCGCAPGGATAPRDTKEILSPASVPKTTSEPTVEDAGKSEPAEAKQANSIEAGRSIGKIEVGASREDVHRVLNNPTGSYRVPPGALVEYWSSKNINYVLRIFYQANKVAQISVQSPQFATPEGITTRSGLDDVQGRYAGLMKSSFFHNGGGSSLVDYYDDIQRGIAFKFVGPREEYTADEKLGANPSLDSILVHQPGRPVINDSEEHSLRK